MRKWKVRTNGIDVMVHQYSASGPPLIFLHFISGNAAVWNGVIPFFTKRYQVFALDMRGHGDSDQPSDGYDIATLANDLLGVVDTLGLDRVHLVGSSLGCYVSTAFASAYSSRVRSLSHSDGAMQNHAGHAGKFTDSREEHLAKLAKPDPTFASAHDYIEYEKQRREQWNPVVERAVMEGWVPSLRRCEEGLLSPKTTNRTYTQLMGSLYDLALEPLYSKIRCPVLFLPAARHRFFNWKNQFIDKVLPNLPPPSKSVTIPGTDHIMLFDHYAEVSCEILLFIEEVERRHTH